MLTQEQIGWVKIKLEKDQNQVRQIQRGVITTKTTSPTGDKSNKSNRSEEQTDLNITNSKDGGEGESKSEESVTETEQEGSQVGINDSEELGFDDI